MHKPVTWPLERAAKIEETAGQLSQAELLELEAVYCSHGDTVHYINPPKIFDIQIGDVVSIHRIVGSGE